MNGAGKPTPFKANMGFLPLSRGKIRLPGPPVRDALRRRQIGELSGGQKKPDFLERAFGGVLGHCTRGGTDLLDDDHAREVSILTDDECPCIQSGC